MLAIVAAALTLGLDACGGSGGAPASSTASSASGPSVPSGTTELGAGVKVVWGRPGNDQSPKAVVMLIHGGSWKGIDPAAFKSTLAIATIFQNLGFETATVEYRRGAQGINDVQRLYRQVRHRVGAHTPICAVGTSAGGHIALMLAVRNPDLACVIDLAGPTNLPALRTDPGGTTGYQIALSAFGNGALTELSPALHAGSIRAKLMLIYAANDPLVPVAQGREMARADPRAKLIVLPPGTAPFVHTGVGAPVQRTGVDVGANMRAQADEVRFLNAVGAAH
ncbi:MAG: alpha/beta hydrolase family protein [Solirubrobacteraceae bacterium]